MKVGVAVLGSRTFRAQELCESRGGRPGFPSLISLTVSVDVKQHFINDILPSRRKVPESDARSVRIVSARLFFSTMLKTLFADLARQAPTRESTHKGVNQRSKYVTQVQQQRPESPRVTLTWHACKYKVHKLHQRYMRVNTKYKVHKLHQRYIYRGCTSDGIYVPCIYTPHQVRVTVGDSGLCCCTCVTYFER